MQQNNVFTIAKRNVEGQDMLYQSLKLTNGIWVLIELKIQPGNPIITVYYSLACWICFLITFYYPAVVAQVEDPECGRVSFCCLRQYLAWLKGLHSINFCCSYLAGRAIVVYEEYCENIIF
jgi:Beta2-adaptin appendage, C-terminal sub-domain